LAELSEWYVAGVGYSTKAGDGLGEVDGQSNSSILEDDVDAVCCNDNVSCEQGNIKLGVHTADEDDLVLQLMIHDVLLVLHNNHPRFYDALLILVSISRKIAGWHRRGLESA
jgi:hypothetical protein